MRESDATTLESAADQRAATRAYEEGEAQAQIKRLDAAMGDDLTETEFCAMCDIARKYGVHSTIQKIIFALESRDG